MPQADDTNVTASSTANDSFVDKALASHPTYPIEHLAISLRRKAYGVGSQEPIRALALSGGGIRSATFSLGLMRGLSELKLLHKFDYLSTVSGGGYAGTFYCGLFARRGDQEPVIDPLAGRDLLGQEDAQRAIGYLRQSGRYLTPAGFGDYIYAVALLLRNWVALTLVIGAAIMLAIMLVDLPRIGMIELSAGSTPLAGPARSYVADYFWLSPLLGLLAIFLIWIAANSWAYWLTMSDVAHPLARPPFWGTLVIIAGAWYLTFGALPGNLDFEKLDPAFLLLLVISTLALASWAACFSLEMLRNPPQNPHSRAIIEDRTRHRLTTLLSLAAMAAFWTGIAATIDSVSFLGFEIYHFKPTISATLVTFLLPFGRWLVRKVSALGLGGEPDKDPAKARKKSIFARLAPLLIWFAAAVFLMAAITFWGSLAHGLTFTLADQSGRAIFPHFNKELYWLAFGLVVLFVALASLTRAFSNLSSLATFYAARLRRAYLGAGNRTRIGVPKRSGEASQSTEPRSVHEGDMGDDMGLFDYYESTRAGAPVHLINVTINATRGRGPATVQRDRHGLNLAISPEGMSYSLSPFEPLVIKPLGHEDFGEQSSDNWINEPPGQSLPLSTWVGISGAAFTTGLGSQTSLAKSILAFLSNVRLGYWWNSYRGKIPWSGCYPNLIREMFASFHGTDHLQWYLSDGGHFENTAVYELVRRQLPLIVVSDNGCDPAYGFADLANLVRKCRIDFGASVDFVMEEDLSKIIRDPSLRELFGSPSDFLADSTNVTAIALLGRINYADGTSGTLLVVKPRLTRNGPNDLLRYLFENPEFPQQTTLDQFFDEAQWESYYELGRLIANRLFRKRLTDSWQPNALSPVTQWPDLHD